MIKWTGFLFIISSLLAGHVVAESPPPPPAEAADEAVTEPEVPANIQRAEARVAQLRRELFALDERIERRANKIIEMATRVKDAEGADNRVVRLQQQVLDGLKNSAQFYVNRRNQLRAQQKSLRSPAIREGLDPKIDWLDEKVEQRIEQFINVTQALATDDSFTGVSERTVYEVRERRSGRDDIKTRTKTTSERKQHDRNVRRADQSRAQLNEGLQNSINRLRSENTRLAAEMQSIRSPERRRLLQEEMEDNEKTIDRRIEQLAQSTSASGPGSQQPMTTHDAIQLEQAVNTLAADIRRDFQRMQQLAARLNREENALRGLKMQQPRPAR